MMYSPESVARARHVAHGLVIVGALFLCGWQGVA